MTDTKEHEKETFPHAYTCTWWNRATGRTGSFDVRYRFVPIPAPAGWTTYPGQQCHEGHDGLLIEDSAARWAEEDLWGAHRDDICLDIGCYGEANRYVCDAHAPDWHGEHLEHVAFERAEDAAAWALRWMASPEQETARARAAKPGQP